MKIEWDPKKAKQTNKDELRAEYKRSDFPKGFEQGKYAERLREASNIVVLDPDVAEVFPDHDSVNQALRSLAEIIKRQKKVA